MTLYTDDSQSVAGGKLKACSLVPGVPHLTCVNTSVDFELTSCGLMMAELLYPFSQA